MWSGDVRYGSSGELTFAYLFTKFKVLHISLLKLLRCCKPHNHDFFVSLLFVDTLLACCGSETTRESLIDQPYVDHYPFSSNRSPRLVSQFFFTFVTGYEPRVQEPARQEQRHDHHLEVSKILEIKVRRDLILIICNYCTWTSPITNLRRSWKL